ncbi:MAG: thiamine pyrophosphate-dependent dehydrogenase E1 component subunit alpha [Nitrospinae bacterium]|nr:thiamine pyrophosphate-dependent dehydrogenase E1 component subunit alpha [Nitrospinota bacterium]
MLTKENKLNMFSTAYRIRRLEEKICEVYGKQEIKTPVHLYIGEEAIATGVSQNLVKEDLIFSTHRSHGHYLAKGGNLKNMVAEFYGKENGCAGGKGGSMHLIDVEAGIPGSTAIVGGGIPIATGAALALQLKGTDKVAVAYFGDGAADEGVLQESMNFAGLKNLPIIFVCENNFYATNSFQMKRHADDNIYKRGECYKVPGELVDGNDVEAVYHTAKKAIERARRGEGPSLIEAKTYRWKGHVGPDEDTNLGHRTNEELEGWKQRCPIKLYREKLFKEGVLDEGSYQNLKREIDNEVEEAFEFAYKSNDVPMENMYKHLF